MTDGGIKNPSISFVIPTYNAGIHIERCLRSIRRQRYPRENVEILVVDGGSIDSTLAIAARYGCRIFENKKRLAEYGVQIGMLNGRGELLVVFAADNELVGDDWITTVAGVFNGDREVSAVWGRLASGDADPPLNKYFQLIQSDPLNWFLNQNLDQYQAAASGSRDRFVFRVAPEKPLVWGANGLVYRADKIKKIWSREGYLGDNDAFQCLIEQGDNKVAYINRPFVYHHHVATLFGWIKKWKRNFSQHLLSKQKTRNMNWVFTKGFKKKLVFWAFYSVIPAFSAAHSVYLSVRDRDIHWLYHPIACLLQTATYADLILFDRDGSRFLKKLIFSEKISGGGK